MITGKTESGFEFRVSKDVANDYELVEILGEMEDNPLLLSTVVNRVLGKEQSKELKDHVRNEQGFVPTDVMMKEIEAIFKSGQETKNS